MVEPYNHFRVAAVLLLIWLVGLIGAPAWPEESVVSVGKAETYVPEYYFNDINHPRCVMELPILGDSTTARRAIFYDVVEKLFEFTNSWSQYFVLVGVDYVGFRRVHFIFFTDCSGTDPLIADVDGILQWSRGNWQIVDGTNLASSAALLGELGPLGIFEKYRSRQAVSSCLVAVQAGEAYLDVLNQLALLRVKYHPPIADVGAINAEIFILFSRTCSAKRELYYQLVELSKREGFSLNALGDPDFSPSAEEYVFVRSGAH
jgi:hypothetical protein